MARSISASILLFVALLVGVTSSNAQLIGTGIQLNVTGGLVCSPLGNSVPGLPNLPLAGVNVTLSCGGTIVGQAATNTSGFFQIVVNASSIPLLSIPSCRIIVPLPVNASCTLLPASGSLQAPIIFTGIASTPLGVLLNFIIAIFVFVPI